MLLSVMEAPLLLNGCKQDSPHSVDRLTTKPYALPRHLREEYAKKQISDSKEDELGSIFGFGKDSEKSDAVKLDDENNNTLDTGQSRQFSDDEEKLVVDSSVATAELQCGQRQVQPGNNHRAEVAAESLEINKNGRRPSQVSPLLMEKRSVVDEKSTAAPINWTAAASLIRDQTARHEKELLTNRMMGNPDGRHDQWRIAKSIEAWIAAVTPRDGHDRTLTSISEIQQVYLSLYHIVLTYTLQEFQRITPNDQLPHAYSALLTNNQVPISLELARQATKSLELLRRLVASDDSHVRGWHAPSGTDGAGLCLEKLQLPLLSSGGDHISMDDEPMQDMEEEHSEKAAEFEAMGSKKRSKSSVMNTENPLKNGDDDDLDDVPLSRALKFRKVLRRVSKIPSRPYEFNGPVKRVTADLADLLDSSSSSVDGVGGNVNGIGEASTPLGFNQKKRARKTGLSMNSNEKQSSGTNMGKEERKTSRTGGEGEGDKRSTSGISGRVATCFCKYHGDVPKNTESVVVGGGGSGKERRLSPHHFLCSVCHSESEIFRSASCSPPGWKLLKLVNDGTNWQATYRCRLNHVNIVTKKELVWMLSQGGVMKCEGCWQLAYGKDKDKQTSSNSPSAKKTFWYDLSSSMNQSQQKLLFEHARLQFKREHDAETAAARATSGGPSVGRSNKFDSSIPAHTSHAAMPRATSSSSAAASSSSAPVDERANAENTTAWLLRCERLKCPWSVLGLERPRKTVKRLSRTDMIYLAARNRYRKWATLVHPDKNKDCRRAHDAFGILDRAWKDIDKLAI